MSAADDIKRRGHRKPLVFLSRHELYAAIDALQAERDELLEALRNLLAAYRAAVKLHDPNTDDAYTSEAHNAIAHALGGPR